MKRYTLIELIAVIVVIAILAVFATARANIFSSAEANLNYSLKLVRSDIRFVQTMALVNDDTSKLFGLSFSPQGYTLTQNGDPADINFPGTSSHTRNFQDIQIASSQDNVNFTLYGTPESTFTISIGSTGAASAPSLTVNSKTGYISESL